ncbi:MAG: TPM domain-containing protein [Gemmatimonadota bacterium]
MRTTTSALTVGLALVSTAAAQRGAPVVPATAPALHRLIPPSPQPASFIADVPNVIPPDAQAALDARIAALQTAGRGDIAVAIMESIGDYAPAEVGVALYRTWRVGRIDSLGSARLNLGVVLLIVPKELAPDHKGQCWITTGTGAEGDITDAVSSRICRDSIIPHLIRQDYAGAVGAGVDAIGERLARNSDLEGSAETSIKPRRERLGPLRALAAIFATLLAIALGVVTGFRWRRMRPRRCPTCGQRMERLSESADDAELSTGQRLEERLKSVDYDVWRCPQGHELVLPYRSHLSRYTQCWSCHLRTVVTTRRTLTEATYVSAGLAEHTRTCKACHAVKVEQVELPRRTPPSSSSSSGSSGGGGGSSFGGSGSTAGGGGGSSY